MVAKEDWAAAMSSDIFREYLKNELIKEANTPPLVTVSEDQALEEFESFQMKVRSDPQLWATFSKLQQKFAADPGYRSKVNSKFVEGVMMLDLTESEER